MGELWHAREVDTELELNLASWETLMALLTKQRAVNAEQQVVITEGISRPSAGSQRRIRSPENPGATASPVTA